MNEVTFVFVGVTKKIVYRINIKLPETSNTYTTKSKKGKTFMEF
jgi:hypothetical protein